MNKFFIYRSGKVILYQVIQSLMTCAKLFVTKEKRKTYDKKKRKRNVNSKKKNVKHFYAMLTKAFSKRLTLIIILIQIYTNNKLNLCFMLR